MAKKTEVETLSPEEMALIQKFREGTKDVDSKSQAHRELAEAFVEAIERTKPKEKKNSFNRPKLGPWATKDGSAKPKLRRVMYHHGLDLREEILSKAEIELLNKVKPGSYCGGFVKVIKRKDRGIDIDYPIKTSSQRLKLSNHFGITSFKGLLEHLINEAANPRQFVVEEDE
jgi:hypothetical protein